MLKALSYLRGFLAALYPLYSSLSVEQQKSIIDGIYEILNFYSNVIFDSAMYQPILTFAVQVSLSLPSTAVC